MSGQQEFDVRWHPNGVIEIHGLIKSHEAMKKLIKLLQSIEDNSGANIEQPERGARKKTAK